MPSEGKFEKIPRFFKTCSKIVKDYEEKEIQEEKILEAVDEAFQKQLEIRAKENEPPRNFFMKIFYKPRTNAEIYGGLVAGNLATLSRLNDIAKFNARQGHGFAAEMANNLSDRLRLINAKVVGGNNATNGPDREISNWFGGDTIRIQSKYCKTGAKCIAECFNKNGEYRYDGMLIEVPYDKYDDAVAAMREKIKQGKIPGVSDPEQAKELVKQGRYRYAEAKNIAEGGNWDAIKFDAKNAAITAGIVGSISALITFYLARSNGDSLKEAREKALWTLFKVGGATFVSMFVASSISREKPAKWIAESLGEKACSVLAENYLRDTKKLTEEDITKALADPQNAENAAAKSLEGNLPQAVSYLVSAVVVIAPEVWDWHLGRISGKQATKNIFVGIGGGMLGGALGALGGKYLGEKVGALIGKNWGPAGEVVGGLVGAVIGLGLAKWLADFIIDDDSKEMVRIIEFEMEFFAGDYLYSSEEFETASKKLSENIKRGDKLKIMFASKDRYVAAANIIIPVLEEVVSSRPKFELPDEENLLQGLGGLVEDAEALKKAPEPQAQEPQTEEEKAIVLKAVAMEFIQSLMVRQYPTLNTRYLVTAAQFGKEIPPCNFDYLEKQVEEALGIRIIESVDYMKICDSAREGTLGELTDLIASQIEKKEKEKN